MIRRLTGLAAALGAAAPLALALPEDRVIVPGSATHSALSNASGGGSFNSLALVGAVLLAAAGAWMLWKKRSGPGGLVREGRLLAIEETRGLGNRQFLVVASYQDRKFLLGVCPGRIDLLAPLAGSDEAERKSS